MGNGLVDRVCAYNKAVSEPTRMKMIKILGSHEASPLKVSEIAEMVGVSQPAASKHLKLMESVGLFDRTRKGTSVYYSINTDALAAYQHDLASAFEHAYTECVNDYHCDTCPFASTCA